MFRVNPLNIFRQLVEPVKAYRRIFKDASTEVTSDEIEIARKIKGRMWQNFEWCSTPINQSTRLLA